MSPPVFGVLQWLMVNCVGHKNEAMTLLIPLIHVCHLLMTVATLQ